MKTEKHDFKNECFVAMPIGGNGDKTTQTLNEFYRYVIKLAVEELDCYCVRADEIAIPGSIKKDIVTHLRKCWVVIADLTGQNPNVLYEVGVRDGSKGAMILLAQSMSDVPSDVRDCRVVIYDVSSPKGCHEAKGRIKEALSKLLGGEGMEAGRKT